MIERRAFSFGLGAALLATAAKAEIRYNGADLDVRERKPLKKLPYTPLEKVPNHREIMRGIIQELARYCHAHAPRMAVLVRNAPELALKGRREWQWQAWRNPRGEANGSLSPMGSINNDYVEAIDGVLIDGMFTGREVYGQPTKQAESAYLLTEAQAVKSLGRPVFSIEYGADGAHKALTAKTAKDEGFLFWFDNEGDKRLGTIPAKLPDDENPDHIGALSEAKNFLVMSESDGFVSRSAWVKALAETNYDVLIVNPFWNGRDPLNYEDMQALKFKKLGARRMVLAEMSVGRALEGAYYWKEEWKEGNPSWLFAKDPLVGSQWVVEYWSDDWKKIMGEYVVAAAKLGFDGILLNHADSYILFEDMMPID
ncbi:alpha-1,4-polygalactosaminidase [Alphaproteobacteria bacterium]|nr:alpha-1,4-polygalactosaminidase [Alphaproteobacteria bacterium]